MKMTSMLSTSKNQSVRRLLVRFSMSIAAGVAVIINLGCSPTMVPDHELQSTEDGTDHLTSEHQQGDAYPVVDGGDSQGMPTTCDTPDCTVASTPISCVPSATLTCLTTPLTAASQRRISFRPNPSMVYAFAIKTPPTTERSFHRVIATGMSGAKSSKLVVISKVPGDIRIDDKDPGCYRLATESTSVELTVNDPNANRYLNCRLEPNTVYYINAASRDFNGQFTCTSSSNCGFYFEGA